MIDKSQYIYGIHAVLEALDAGQDIDKILLSKTLNAETAQKISDTARQLRIPVQRVPVQKIDRITRRNHQGVLAMMAAVTYYHVEDLVPQLFDKGENPFFVVLDGVTDVRNFGAVARTCDCASVSAIVIPDRESVSVNADAVKTSAGALNYLPVCREFNLAKAVKLMRDSGIKIVGTDDKTHTNYTKANFTGPVAIVLGSEDKGISPEIKKLCDTLVTIPEFGHINSLNVSVAGGIIIYEVVRQRLNDNQEVE
jgi:23S rRNA (guanosine2251-2'-O)-methyltransferase